MNLVRENIEFTRGKNIHDALKVGLYHNPWTVEEIYSLPDGFYIAIEKEHAESAKSVIKKDGATFTMETSWTRSGPELWNEVSALNKENVIDIAIEGWFNENVEKIIPMKKSIFALCIFDLKKHPAKCSWKEIINANES